MKFTQFCLIVFAILFITVACSESKKSEDENNADNDNTEISDDDSAELPDENAKSPDFEDLECGTSFGDYACDFTLPFDSGDWNFAENYSKDENYLFVFYRKKSSSSKQIWESDLYTVFEQTPENTHYFFIIDTDDADFAKEKIQIIKDSVQDAQDMVGNAPLLKKIHILERPVAETDSWINDWLKNNSDFFFGIDGERRIRQGGSFATWDSNAQPLKFKHLYKETELYNYERQIANFIKENSSTSTVFKGIENKPFAEEGWTKEIFFDIDFNGLSENGELFISLEQICDTPKSCEWDRLERLFLCDETGEKCETEIGRWITTYGRSGKWLTDITPLKPIFEKNGKYKFRFTVDGDYYVNNLDFVFVKKEEADTPKSIIPLFNQLEQFDEDYNSKFEPQTIKSNDVKKAEIVAFITGHGNNSEAANCAEFCPFESVFTVNSNDFKIDFKDAGNSDGCFEQVVEGVVPNQYGSWPYGRAGWCPGQNVKLIRIDVTKALASGENTFSYGAYLNGEIYEPVVTNENGYRAEIYLSSYLVIY